MPKLGKQKSRKNKKQNKNYLVPTQRSGNQRYGVALADLSLYIVVAS